MSIIKKSICKVKGHSWNGCKCIRCGLVRDEGHEFQQVEYKCEQRCSICEKVESLSHQWEGKVCSRCGANKGLNDSLGELADKWWPFLHLEKKNNRIVLGCGLIVVAMIALFGILSIFEDKPDIDTGTPVVAEELDADVDYALERDGEEQGGISQANYVWRTEAFGGIIFEVDASWEKESNDSGEKCLYYPPLDEPTGFFQGVWIDMELGGLTDKEARETLDSGVESMAGSVENAQEISRTYYKIGDRQAIRASYYIDSTNNDVNNDKQGRVDVVVVLFEDGAATLMSLFTISEYELYEVIIENALSSVKVDKSVSHKVVEKQDENAASVSSPPSSEGTQEQATQQVDNSANKEVTVYVTNTGDKYHIESCRHLKSKNAISLASAKARGFTACGTCHPPN